MSITSASRALGQNARHTANYIVLRGIPRSATPADIRRALEVADVQGISDIAIDYKHFVPSEMALLTLINPEFLDENIRKLKRMSIAGMPTLAFPKTMNSPPTPTRVRGIKGLREAAERGLLTGNGPHAGLLNWGRNVTLWGLPKMLDEKELYDDLQQFEFASDSKAQPNLVKVLPPEGTFTMVSRFLITLEEAAEAHRFVHSIHYTYWKPQHYRTKYLMRARILY